MKFFDTHCHLNFSAFKGERRKVILKAQKKGVEFILNVGSNLTSSQKAIELSRQNKACLAGVGVHPIHIKENYLNQIKAIEDLISQKEVVAIGETGLDFYWTKNKKEQEYQKQAFKKFIFLANQYRYPLIIHSREAQKETLKILEKEKPSQGVWHCFKGDWSIAQAVIKLGLHISFTGLITYNLSRETRKIIELLPLEKILIETDAPFLAPWPERTQGIKRNEPQYVTRVAEKIAEIKKRSFHQTASVIFQNSKKLFKVNI